MTNDFSSAIILSVLIANFVYVKKLHGTIADVVERIMLLQIFLARSLKHLVMPVFWMDSNGQEKASAYRRAAIRLFFGSTH